MSNLTHCDGPGCDKTEDRISRRLCDGSWIRVDQGEGAPKLDFHDRQTPCRHRCRTVLM